MTTEDHRLLMEALMFFSSGDDSDDTNTRNHSSDHNAVVAVRTKSVVATRTAPPSAIRHAQHETSTDPFNEALTNPTRNKNVAPLMTPANKPLRRKRVKKCTYAARREEVARLRSSTFQLEAQLQHMQKRSRSGDAYRQRAQYEQELLAQAQAENQRLRALVAANAARIHEQRHTQSHHGHTVQEYQL